MKSFLASLGRAVLTLVVVLVAILAGWELWSYYMLEPWTRDGRVPPLGDNLLQTIDMAIDEVAACTAATRTSVAAIVGVRRTLYPDAAPHQPAQTAPSERASVT